MPDLEIAFVESFPASLSKYAFILSKLVLFPSIPRYKLFITIVGFIDFIGKPPIFEPYNFKQLNVADEIGIFDDPKF